MYTPVIVHHIEPSEAIAALQKVHPGEYLLTGQSLEGQYDQVWARGDFPEDTVYGLVGTTVIEDVTYYVHEAGAQVVVMGYDHHDMREVPCWYFKRR